MLTKNDVIDILKKSKGGSFDSFYGPIQFAEHVAWEIWVKQDGEYETHFIVSDEINEPMYFNGFLDFCVFVNNLYGKKADVVTQLNADKTGLMQENHKRNFVLKVADFAFIATVLTFLYMILRQIPIALNVLPLFASLLGSGGLLFFGVWKQPAMIKIK
ncbi:MAG: hypothetical protein ACREO1_10720 [Arenimonas sp.]